MPLVSRGSASTEGMVGTRGDLSAVVAFGFNRSKRNIVAALFPGASVRFIDSLPWRDQDYPESRGRAAAALETATRRPRAAWLVALRTEILRRHYNAVRADFERNPNAVAVTWNGLVSTRSVFMMAARDAGARTLFLERGPFPGTLTADPAGVNYANSLPRDPAPYKAWAAAHPDELGRWRPLAALLVQRPSTILRQPTQVEAPPLSDPFVFVPLQKHGDTQLRFFGNLCVGVPETIELLASAVDALPRGWHLRIKEHPSDRRRFGATIARHAARRIYLDNATDTFSQVRASQAVLTVNSSVGLEAMLLEKPVTTMGKVFWALPGLVQQAATLEDLRSVLAAPSSFVPDAELRDALLSFLWTRYYLMFPYRPAKGQQLPPEDLEKLRERVVTGRVL